MARIYQTISRISSKWLILDQEHKDKQKANQTHYEVGKKVRKTIEELGGEMPENLPVADSIKAIDKNKEPRLLKPRKKKNE